MIVEELGDDFQIPIKDVAEFLTDYQVYGAGDFRRVLDEKVIPYKGDMITLVTGDTKLPPLTPWHIQKVLLDDSNEVLLYVRDIEVGMQVVKDEAAHKITGIEHSEYDGLVYGFEVEGQPTKPQVANVLRNCYNDGTVEFVIED